MRIISVRSVLAMLTAFMCAPGFGRADGTTIEPLQGKEWQSLAMVTGFHTLANRKLGLAMRVLEADGSASVAENPVSLFVVVTNEGILEPEVYIWRLPVQVAVVRKVKASRCGLDITAEVEGEGEPGAPGEKSLTTIKACFLSNKGKPESKLRMDVGFTK